MSDKPTGRLVDGSDIAEVPEWIIREFEGGYHPMDEPPGFEERWYRIWSMAGGKVKPKPPVTADDL